MVWFGTPKPGLLYTAPPAESAGVGLSVVDRQAIEEAAERIEEFDLDGNKAPEAVALRAILSRTHAADGEAGERNRTNPDEPNMPKRGTLAWLVRLLQQLQAHGTASEAKVYINDPTFGRVEVGGALYGIADVELTPNDDDEPEQAAQQHAEPSHADSFASKAVYATAIADAQQAEPESVIKRQAQKIGELIADRDSWIEAHARLYRLYHDQSPKAGEEIHVNVEGGDVYTLPLQLSGMDKPRFVVHVPRPQQAEPHPSQAHPTFQTVSLPNGPGTPSAQTFDRRIACKAGKPEWKSCAQQAEPGADERAEFETALKQYAEACHRSESCSAMDAARARVCAIFSRAAQSGQRAGVAVAKGEIWYVRLKGAGALTTLEMLEVTSATILAKRPGDYYETRYSRADVDFVELAAPTQQQERSES